MYRLKHYTFSRVSLHIPRGTFQHAEQLVSPQDKLQSRIPVAFCVLIYTVYANGKEVSKAILTNSFTFMTAGMVKNYH
jgi:hypothetical protein